MWFDRLLQASVVVFTDDARRDLAVLNRDGLINHALLLRVITHFDVTGDREILAERVTNETVVVRMRRKSAWPSNMMPKRSKASRSYQFAEFQMRLTEATTGKSSSGQNTFKRIRWFSEIDRR